MANEQFSVLFQEIFQVGINIRPAEHGDGRREGGQWEGDKPPYSHFEVAVANWDSYKAPTKETFKEQW